MRKSSSIRKSAARISRPSMVSVRLEEDASYETATADLTDGNSELSNKSLDHQIESLSSYETSFRSSSSGRLSVTRSSGSNIIRNSLRSSRKDRMSIRLSHAESAQNTNVGNLTMNKLRFASLQIHGRKKEIHILRKCFDRFVKNVVIAEADEGDGTVDSPKQQNLTHNGSKPSRMGSINLTQICPDIYTDNGANLSEVVLISGESGTGKVSKECVHSDNGLILSYLLTWY